MMGRRNALEGGSHDERVDAEAKADHVALAMLRNRTLTPTPLPVGEGLKSKSARQLPSPYRKKVARSAG